MTEEIDKDEEIIENTEQTPAKETETQIPQVPVISSPSQVEPITSTELFEHALELLFPMMSSKGHDYFNK